MTLGDDEARSNLIGSLFYLITAAAEDAASIAARGQSSRIPVTERRLSGAELGCVGKKIAIFANAIEILCAES
jgi:hypothetical protein